MLSRVWLRPRGLQQIRAFLSSHSLLKLMFIESVMPSNLILCHPLLLFPSIFPSITVFSSESAFCIRWPKYWSFSFSISPSNEYLGLIFFRIDGFDPWVRKILWRRKWQPIPVFLLGKSHGQRSLAVHWVAKNQTRLSTYACTRCWHSVPRALLVSLTKTLQILKRRVSCLVRCRWLHRNIWAALKSWMEFSP